MRIEADNICIANVVSIDRRNEGTVSVQIDLGAAFASCNTTAGEQSGQGSDARYILHHPQTSLWSGFGE